MKAMAIMPAIIMVIPSRSILATVPFIGKTRKCCNLPDDWISFSPERIWSPSETIGVNDVDELNRKGIKTVSGTEHSRRTGSAAPSIL